MCASTVVFSESVRERVFSAADSVYADLNKERMPTVQEVRAVSRTDNNATSALLREWKKLITTAPAPVSIDVPNAVRDAGLQAVQVAWSVAQAMATESLRSAEQSWELEREDSEMMRRELADIADSMSLELRTAQDENERLSALNADLLEKLSQQTDALISERGRSERSESRASELELRVADLKEELKLAHAEVATVRGEITDIRLAHLDEKKQLETIAAEQIERARTELAVVRNSTESKILDLSKQVSDLLEEQRESMQSLATFKARDEQNQEQRKAAAQEAHRQAERYLEKERALTTAHGELVEVKEKAARLDGQVKTLEIMVNKFQMR